MKITFSIHRMFFGIAVLLVGVIPTAQAQLAASVLPSSRSVQVGTPATVFATLINASAQTATACNIAPLTTISADFSYQTTDPTTNAPTGTPNTPIDIPAGQMQSFILTFIPTASFAATEVQLRFGCANTDPAAILPGINTLLLSASGEPVPDIVALAATVQDDGIVTIPGSRTTGVFSLATVNVGTSGTVTVSADTGGIGLPDIITLCETNPATAACKAVPATSVTLSINANATPTFSLFVESTAYVPFNPSANRIFVRFRDATSTIVGTTSVAVRGGADLVKVSGDKQIAVDQIREALVVLLRDRSGNSVKEVPVRAEILQGQAEIFFLQGNSLGNTAQIRGSALVAAQTNDSSMANGMSDDQGEARFSLRIISPNADIRTRISAPELPGVEPEEFLTIPGFASPVDIAAETNGQLVVVDRSFGVVRVNPDSGTRTLVSGVNPVTGMTIGNGPLGSPVSIAVEADDRLVVVGGFFDVFEGAFHGVVRVDPVSGDRTVISGRDPENPENLIGNGPPVSPEAIAVGLDGTLWVVEGAFGEGLRAVVRVNPDNGDRTITSNATTGSGPTFFTLRDIAIGVDGDPLVVGDFTDTGDLSGVIRVDRATGNRTLVSDVNTCPLPPSIDAFSIAVEELGTLVVLDNTDGFDASAVLRIDPSGAPDNNCSVVSRAATSDTSGFGTGETLLRATGIAVKEDGNLVVVDEFLDAVVQVNPVNGNRSIVSRAASIGQGRLLLVPRALAVEDMGNLIVADSGIDETVVRVNPATSDRTVVSGCAEILCASAERIGDSEPPFSVTISDIAIASTDILVMTGVVTTSDSFDPEFPAVMQVNLQTGVREVFSGCPGEDCSNSAFGSGPPLQLPLAVAVEADGAVVVLDGGSEFGPARQAVVRVDTEGNRLIISGCTETALDSFQCTGEIVGTGSPSFIDPKDIAIETDGSLVVVDALLGQVVRVNPDNGNRETVSGCTEVNSANFDCIGSNRGSGPSLVTDRIAVEASGSLVVAGSRAIVRVDRDNGNRSLVSGIHPVTQEQRGNGPLFARLMDIESDADGNLFVVDQELQAMIHVDPVTGDRTIVSR